MRVITDLTKPDWDTVIARAVTSDVYHTAGYHRLAEWNGEGKPHLFTYETDGVEFALPLLLRPLPDDEPGQDATSVYGYAGPLCSVLQPPAAAVEAFQHALSAALTELSVISVFSRLHPYIETAPVAGLGEVARSSDTVSLDLSVDHADAQLAYRKSHRRTVRRSIRDGLRCEVDEDLVHLSALSEIYAETMERTGAGESLRFDEDYFRRTASELPHSIVHFVCFDVQNEIVGASIYLRSEHYLHAHLGGSRSDMGLISPATVETDFARQWGTEAGLRYLNLGGGVGGSDDSLLSFKLGFSKNLVPFSTWKWIVDPARYQELCPTQGKETGFFPSYRSPQTSPHS